MLGPVLCIGWCAAVAGAAEGLKLSKEMGALIAGLSIAAFPYSIHVTAKTLPDWYKKLDVSSRARARGGRVRRAALRPGARGRIAWGERRKPPPVPQGAGWPP